MESNQILEIIYILEDSFIGEYIRSSLWLFPVIQSFHLIGLGILELEPCACAHSTGGAWSGGVLASVCCCGRGRCGQNMRMIDH